MPQMSPMWWETLFMMFIMNYIMINTIMFWYKDKTIKYTDLSIKIKNMNWKW